MNELDLFAAAIAVAEPAERAALLDRECAGRPDLRQRLDDLLGAHARSHHLFDADLNATAAQVPSEQPGELIAGRYKLLELIGEGGMGAVWVAEQSQPVRRKVALKLIKAGMDSKAVLARFEAERQALALMDHPNIAKVLDGGLTERGRPYFVMEYVKGVPITEYCDAARLNVSDRLALFVQVCHAVQHAHQKGIIHRDLKPSNILVAPYDDKPVPKIIDFGLAKAMHQSLTEKTLHTAHESVLGTPLYMSPEQAQLNNLDVDTRSDVYSLGVLLYELLTGTTPVERQRFKQAAWDEVRRIIREEEPQRPSARLSSTDTLPSVAAGRQTEPVRLTKLVRGELDWIVMKALEKDRTRRYETANGFAMDVVRFLTGEPVLAVPPSASYRLRKFARKHRAPLTTACTIVALLVAGIGITAWQAVRATRAEAAARQAEVQASQDRADAIEQRQLAERRAAEAVENERKAREADESSKAVLDFVQDYVFHTVKPERRGVGLGKNVTMLEALNAAEPKVAAAFGTRPRVEAQVRMMLLAAYNTLGDKDRADPQLERAYSLARTGYGPDDPFTVGVEWFKAYTLRSTGQPEEGTRLLEEALARRRKELGPAHEMTRQTMRDLASFYSESGRSDEARKLAEELLKDDEPQWNAQSGDPEKAWRVASLYYYVGKPAETVRGYEALLPRISAKFGPDDPRTLRRIHTLAQMLQSTQRLKEAIDLLEPAYLRAVRTLGANDERTLRMLITLTAMHLMGERYAEAARILEEALPALRKQYGAANPQLGPHYVNLSEAYNRQKKYQESVTLLEDAIKAIPEKEQEKYGNFEFLLNNLAEAYHGLGDTTNARKSAVEMERWIRAYYKADRTALRSHLGMLADVLINIEMFTEAERVVREIIASRKESAPTDERRITTVDELRLGRALFGQKRDSDAEPLLRSSYENLTARRTKLGPVWEEQRVKVGRTLAQLYDRTGRPDKAAALRAQLPPEQESKLQPSKKRDAEAGEQTIPTTTARGKK